MDRLPLWRMGSQGATNRGWDATRSFQGNAGASFSRLPEENRGECCRLRCYPCPDAREADWGLEKDHRVRQEAWPSLSSSGYEQADGPGSPEGYGVAERDLSRWLYAECCGVSGVQESRHTEGYLGLDAGDSGERQGDVLLSATDEEEIMLTVWFIRHAQSLANAGEKTNDPGAIELTDLGQKQADYIGNYFERDPDLIVSSPFIRARQTAQFLTSRVPNVPAEVWPVQEFTYLNPERCQNTTTAERSPMADEYWERYDPHYVDGGSAESFASLMERVDSMWNILLEMRGDKWVVMFSHAMFIKAALWRWLHPDDRITPQGMRHYRNFLYSFPIPNGSILEAGFDRQLSFGPPLTDHLPEELKEK